MSWQANIDTGLLEKAFTSVRGPTITRTSTPCKSNRSVAKVLQCHMGGFHSTRPLNRAAETVPRLGSAGTGRTKAPSHARSQRRPQSQQSMRPSSQRPPSRSQSQLGEASRYYECPGFKSDAERMVAQRRYHLQAGDMPMCRPREPTVDGMPAEALLDTLGVPPMQEYQMRLPAGGGNMNHPGLVLPGVYQTSQALFGTAASKAGTPTQLQRAASTVPGAAPRYCTHDTVSATSSIYSNFRKTNVAWAGERSTLPQSEYRDRYVPWISLPGGAPHRTAQGKKGPASQAKPRY